MRSDPESRSRTVISALFAALVTTASVLAGCDSGLVEAIDELRAAAPTVCKNYCEEKVNCVFPDSVEGDEADAAFSAGVERCTVDCAFYTGKGAYVARIGEEEDIEFFSHVSGDDLLGALECGMASASFSCADSEPDSVYGFGAVVESYCEDADGCLELLGIDQHLEWIPSPSGEGGTCTPYGDEWLDAEFFLP